MKDLPNISYSARVPLPEQDGNSTGTWFQPVASSKFSGAQSTQLIAPFDTARVLPPSLGPVISEVFLL